MAKATKQIRPEFNPPHPFPYQLNLSGRELGWLARLAEIAYEMGGMPGSQEEEDFNVWLIDLQETFRQLDKSKASDADFIDNAADYDKIANLLDGKN